MKLKSQPEKGVKYWAFYWIRVGVLIAGGLYIEDWLNEKAHWIIKRYTVYHALHSLTPRKPRPERIALVLIGDDEYWRGELGSRVPIKRDYLAKLIQAIEAANPKVIAFDFSLRSPSPDGNPPEALDYQGETQKLLEAVKSASGHRAIVLPKTIEMNEGRYISESDIYKGFEFDENRVRKGYIILPDDPSRVPLLSLNLEGERQPVDSLSQAVARAFDEKSIPPLAEDGSLPFGSYIPVNQFPTVTATDVLNGDTKALEKLAFKAVIIGGVWHSRGYNRGPLIDSKESPLGFIPGVFIHANHAESILDSRLYWPVKGRYLHAIDIFFSLLVGILFALNLNPFIKLMSVPFLCLGLILFSYFCLMNLGLFFDFFIPVLLVIGHGVAEQTYHGSKKILVWRADALKWNNYQKIKEKEREESNDHDQGT